MVKDKLENIVFPLGALSKITIKEPKTICPKHGDTKGFNVDFDGSKFCLHCVKEKIIELGVYEVTVERD